MKHKKFLLTLFLLPLLAVSVHGYEGRRGERDDILGDRFSEREPIIWKTGEYLVRNYNKKRAWIEDFAGNDIEILDSMPQTVDKQFGVYLIEKDGKRVLYGKNGEFGSDIDAEAIIIPVRFPKFTIIAATMPEKDEYRLHTEVTDPARTVYYDTDGNKIQDVYKYIAEKGEKPENGIYYDQYDSGNISDRSIDRPFLPRAGDPEPVLGVPDRYPFCKVTNCREIKSLEQRIIEFSVPSPSGQGIYGTVVEDKTAKDRKVYINNNDCSDTASVNFWSEKYGLYWVYHQSASFQGDMSRCSVFNKDFRNIGGNNMYSPTCYDFGDFCLICFDSGDLSSYEKHTYYDIDGNAVENIDQYLEERGKTMSDAVYTRDMPFHKCRDTFPVTQNPYDRESTTPSETLPRVARVIVGSGTEEVWLEDYSGKDLTGIINGKVEMLHYGCNVYKITYFDGSMELFTPDFELFGKGDFDVNVLDFDGEFIIAESPKGVSPYDTEKAVYYDPDGNLITDIKAKTGKDISEGKISVDNINQVGKAGYYNTYYTFETDVDPKIYPKRTHVKGTDLYITGKEGNMWLESKEGGDVLGHWRAKNIEPLIAEKVIWHIADENNGKETYSCVGATYNEQYSSWSYDVLLSNCEKYFRPLEYHGLTIFAGSNEDVSPYDVDKNTYYMVYPDKGIEVINGINECLAMKNLRLSDFTAVPAPETEIVELTPEEIK
ncbi:MAG: hypothetical protein IJL89_11070 [Firmicutes bacterium]|nr:hypothetical protein [Bacillota bacterium]